LLARPGGGHGRGGGGRALARPSADSLSGRLRVGFAWRGPCAALRKAACAEGASGASFGRCAPPAAGGGPCRRAPGGQDGETAPQRRSLRCKPVQHSAAWSAASWICARRSRGCSGAVLQAAASGARHARRRAWPGQRHTRRVGHGCANGADIPPRSQQTTRRGRVQHWQRRQALFRRCQGRLPPQQQRRATLGLFTGIHCASPASTCRHPLPCRTNAVQLF